MVVFFSIENTFPFKDGALMGIRVPSIAPVTHGKSEIRANPTNALIKYLSLLKKI